MASSAPYRDWCADVHGLGVARVAEVFGGRLVDESRPWQGLTPCPACKAETRHTKRNDKRGAVALVAEGNGWLCLQCEAKGDAVTWAAYAVTGQSRPSVEVRAACERAGLVGNAASGLTPRPRLAVGTGPKYPPVDEISKLMGACGAVIAESQTASWLLSIPLDTALVAELGAVGALPETTAVPSWARFGNRTWARAGYRLIAPLVDTQGVVRSVHARFTANAKPPSNIPKTLNPKGYSTRGLVLASPHARCWLSGKKTPQTVVVAEGLRDWLTQLYDTHIKGKEAAVLGIVGPGGWTQSLADKIPRGCRLVIATDHDSQGDKYAAAIVQTLANKMSRKELAVFRWRPTQ